MCSLGYLYSMQWTVNFKIIMKDNDDCPSSKAPPSLFPQFSSPPPRSLERYLSTSVHAASLRIDVMTVHVEADLQLASIG